MVCDFHSSSNVLGLVCPAEVGEGVAQGFSVSPIARLPILGFGLVMVGPTVLVVAPLHVDPGVGVVSHPSLLQPRALVLPLSGPPVVLPRAVNAGPVPGFGPVVLKSFVAS